MFNFRCTSSAGKHTKTILSHTMGQKKLSFKLLFITSPNYDGFKKIVTVRPSRKSTIKVYDTSHHQGFIEPPRRGEYFPPETNVLPLREDHQLPPSGEEYLFCNCCSSILSRYIVVTSIKAIRVFNYLFVWRCCHSALCSKEYSWTSSRSCLCWNTSKQKQSLILVPYHWGWYWLKIFNRSISKY